MVDEVEVIGDVGMKNEWIWALSGSGREKWGKWGNSSAEDKVGGGGGGGRIYSFIHLVECSVVISEF